MKIIPELKKIAGHAAAIGRLVDHLNISGKLDTDGLGLEAAYLVDGCREKNRHLYRGDKRLDRQGLVDDLYYCYQKQGYMEDDFYGTLYFKTNVPGQFVAVPFEC